MLTEMPKVGDKVRYVGVPKDWLTIGKVYDVVDVYPTRGAFAIGVDGGGRAVYHTFEFGRFELVTAPDLLDIVANLTRRMAALEAAKATPKTVAVDYDVLMRLLGGDARD